ncbi:McrB family protein [Hymenobacter sp. DG01]|uniref:McrB family protein n=1 Tax=Hymenobacter sp. DG01 TaxID=2584940 RepID=UPI0011211378|nr:AAA family ATPase [Hymenobacter sp. DG01]
MSRPYVTNSIELQKNFRTFIKLRESRNQDDVEQYRAYLRSAKVLVVEKVDGQREYAPSRFVGYKNNSVAEHEEDTLKHGGLTTAQLERLYTKWVYDPIETERYARFCKKYGVGKDFSQLRTPPKFIFASYSASDEATRIKPTTEDKDMDDDIEETSSIDVNMPLNQILYGPPGTGKTYHTVARAVALLEGMSDEELVTQYPADKRQQLREKFEQYRAAGRIAFVTFHQAFSYEDFIEGIKPLPPTKDGEDASGAEPEAKPVQYDVVPGIFRRICESAAAAANTATIPNLPDFDTLYDEFVEQLHQRMLNTRGSLTFYSKTGLPVTLKALNLQSKRLTFLHDNSAQQDHNIDKKWIKKICDKYTSIDQIKHLKQDITDVVGGSNASLQWVVFREFKKYEAAFVAQEREKQKTTPAPSFVLIIDEINRGNVANIFGELITLLEDDKRAGKPEFLTITLPYSKEEFSVPQNLYLLGTMNTADRSVEALDTALRRRFSFTEMLPQPHLLPDDVEGVNLQEMLRAINARLEQLLDHDHCIGHALLMQVSTLDDLREAFRRNILPLLQEYFFGDWGKIGLVIGSPFIQQVNKNQPAGSYKLLSFGSFSTKELSEKPVYRLTDTLQLDAQAFKSIYASF